MRRPTFDCECISSPSKLSQASHFCAHLAALDMEDFVLIDMDVLKWNVPARVYGPFHGESFLGGRNTAECLARNRIREGLVQVNCHTELSVIARRVNVPTTAKHPLGKQSPVSPVLALNSSESPMHGSSRSL